MLAPPSVCRSYPRLNESLCTQGENSGPTPFVQITGQYIASRVKAALKPDHVGSYGRLLNFLDTEYDAVDNVYICDVARVRRRDVEI